jgi:hypothetical protein
MAAALSIFIVSTQVLPRPHALLFRTINLDRRNCSPATATPLRRLADFLLELCVCTAVSAKRFGELMVYLDTIM